MKGALKRALVAIDCEYVAEGAVQGRRPDVAATFCEVMQVGACRLDEAGAQVGLLNVTVRRHRLAVPEWLAELTGMSDAKRESGVAFPEALARLVAFCEGAELWIFSGDWDVLQGNCREHGVPFPLPAEVGRAKALLRDKGVTLERFAACGFHEVCSGGMGRVLGIELPDDGSVGAHDAAYDARSLAHAVYKLKQLE